MRPPSRRSLPQQADYTRVVTRASTKSRRPGAGDPGLETQPGAAMSAPGLQTWCLRADGRRHGEVMENFEQFVAVAMESERLIVSEAVKFLATRLTSWERERIGWCWPQ